MTAQEAWRSLTSSRATMTILVLLGSLLLLNVVVPQVAIVGQDGVERAVGGSEVLRFLLVHMHLSELSTSPLFIGTVVLFFLNLALVLVDRTHATLKRLRFVPPTEAQVHTMSEASSAMVYPLPDGWTPARAEEVLSRLGYRVSRPGPHAAWGLRHATAILGFPLFHLSFFVLCAGGLAIYSTRYVTTLIVTEGQPFSTRGGGVVRIPPRGPPPPQELLVQQAHARLVDGRPVQLGAVLQRLGGAAEAPREAWVNEPAEWGSLSVLVERAGLSPVLWLRDAQGYSVDRVAAPAFLVGGVPSRTPLAGGAYTVEVAPVAVGHEFPAREALPRHPVSLVVRRGEEVLFDGALVAGQFADLGGPTLKLEELRYWVSLRVVDEQGGLLLVIGFLLAVTGLTWRLLWFRREVGVWWDESRLVLVARVEYFPTQFREELEAIHALLAGTPRHGGPGRSEDEGR